MALIDPLAFSAAALPSGVLPLDAPLLLSAPLVSVLSTAHRKLVPRRRASDLRLRARIRNRYPGAGGPTAA